MNSKITKFCKDNPYFKFNCRFCGTLNKIPMNKFLQKKYEYDMKCKKCSKINKIDTKDMHNKINNPLSYI